MESACEVAGIIFEHLIIIVPEGHGVVRVSFYQPRVVVHSCSHYVCVGGGEAEFGLIFSGKLVKLVVPYPERFKESDVGVEIARAFTDNGSYQAGSVAAGTQLGVRAEPFYAI